MMRFFTVLYYLVIGPFKGKFMFAFKSPEEIERLNSIEIPRVIAVISAPEGAKPRHVKKSLKKILGKNFQHVADTYLGVRVDEFFANYPPDIKYVANYLINQRGISVTLEGGEAEHLYSLFDSGLMSSDYPGILIRKPRFGNFHPKEIYESVVQNSYDQYTRAVLIPKECPACNSPSWYFRWHNKTCDECEEHIELNLELTDDTAEQVAAMEKHRMETDKVYLKIET